MPHPSCCSACGTLDTPKPRVGAWLALAVGSLSFLCLLALLPGLGFAMFMVSPIVAVAGLGIGPLARQVQGPPLCPACHRSYRPVPRLVSVHVARVDPLRRAA